jgi:hypothetical protein
LSGFFVALDFDGDEMAVDFLPPFSLRHKKPARGGLV